MSNKNINNQQLNPIYLDQLTPDTLIRVLKALNNVTTKELAEMLGVSYPNLSAVEGGRLTCGSKLQMALITFCNLDPKAFLIQVEIFNTLVSFKGVNTNGTH